KGKRKKGEEYPERGPEEEDKAHARGLIGKMLDKTTPIRKRWKDGTAREILEDELGIVEEMPLPTLDDVIEDHGGDVTEVVKYGGADADGTRRIDPIVDAQIEAYGLRGALDTTIGILPMVDRMQTVGMKVNVGHFEMMVPILEERARGLDDAIAGLAGKR